jgi:hypothetical protein
MSVNPYIEGRKKEIELNKRRKLLENDIEFIKRDLENKTKALLESRVNHITVYNTQIKEIKDSCTHLNEDGTMASSLTHKDILIPVEGGYKKQNFCEFCGAKFDGGFIEVKSVKQYQQIEQYEHSIDDDDDDDDVEILFSDVNLTFDPNFNTNEFLGKTFRFFTDVVNPNKK